ncbi:hypothetical protein [Streptomyces sp. E5N91]|uniref:hypothetical protein n=1 Tax=Streptomyces sp. E5N91 TaxID=1851996 RepID=UPI000EF5973F|nr:hypothetical protein [Streptomyces sp. E5N91]
MKLTTRHLIHGAGRHRATPTAERIEVPLDDLLGGWPIAPSHAPGALGAQCWDDCPRCGYATAGLLHPGGFTCGECLTTSPVQP